ncbi:MAG: hypothetical protein AABX38_05800 [Candidatus Micrarchaeota archaeon]
MNDFATVLMYKLIDNVRNQKQESLVSISFNAFFPFIKIALILLFIDILILGGVFLVLYLFTKEALSLLLLIVLLPLLSLVSLLVKFFLQFSLIEFALNKRGAIESIVSSINLTKKNILKVFAFSLVYLFLISGSFLVFNINADFLSNYISNSLVLEVINTIISSFFLSLAQIYFYVSLVYFFWLKIKDTK